MLKIREKTNDNMISMLKTRNKLKILKITTFVEQNIIFKNIVISRRSHDKILAPIRLL